MSPTKAKACRRTRHGPPIVPQGVEPARRKGAEHEGDIREPPDVLRGQGREPSGYSSSSRCFMNFARSSPFRVLSAIVFQTTLASFAAIGSSAGRRLKTRS